MPKYVTGGFDTTKTKQSIDDISMFFTLNSWKILNGIWILHELKSSLILFIFPTYQYAVRD